MGKRTAYMRKWRKLHPDKVKVLDRNKHQRTKEFVRLMKNKPCADCGNKFPYYIMEFDHVRGKKKNNVSTIKTGGRAVILNEIAKCDVVCSNCHRTREYVRGINNPAAISNIYENLELSE